LIGGTPERRCDAFVQSLFKIRVTDVAVNVINKPVSANFKGDPRAIGRLEKVYTAK
jgi:hypothetical protein